MAFLEMKAVAKGFGEGSRRAEVLEDINLEIEEGEFVAVVGYSGAGKTTLMALLAGLIAPDRGTLTLEGKPIREPGRDRGVVFQNYSLLPWLTVFENIALAVDQVFPAWSSKQRREQVEKYIAMVNLTPARNKKPGELSGGMRQRVSVARGLATEPRVLLLDEPLGALDALTRGTLQDEISRIWQETRTTVLLITNDPDEGIFLADRIIPLTAGPRATLGPPISIPLPRPREKTMINHCPEFKRIRAEVIDYLLKVSRKKSTSLSRKLVLPDIEPENLELHPKRPFEKRRPVRRSEIREETMEVKT